MRIAAELGRIMAFVLIGLGAAVTVKGMQVSGFEHFDLRYVVGPGLAAAGVARLKLQSVLGDRGGGDDGGDQA